MCPNSNRTTLEAGDAATRNGDVWLFLGNHYFLILVMNAFGSTFHIRKYHQSSISEYNIYDAYRGTMGILFSLNILCFGTNRDANWEIMSCQVLFYQLLHTSKSGE